jgi:HTH-type transcriptional regulator/antitoxin HigA
MLNQFKPDWVSPPGETILHLMGRKNFSIEALSNSSGFAKEKLEDVISGKEKITPRFAELISSELGGSVDFWIRREKNYRDSKVSLSKKIKNWVDQFPYSDLAKFGWVDSTRNVLDKYSNLLNYFSSDSIEDWESKFNGLVSETSYRVSNSFNSDAYSVVAWLSKAEIDMSNATLGEWDSEGLKSKLPELRALTRIKDPKVFIPMLKEKLNSSGVSLSIIPNPKGCSLNGAKYTSMNGTPVIILSSRYLSDDQFWFTFFHELAHVLLHEDKLMILEGGKTEEALEDEANEFSSKLLIPEIYMKELMTLSIKNWRKIPRFAKKINVSSGIVVGQLQFKKAIPASSLNKLKTRYIWINHSELVLK